ncbi:MAG: glyoxalase [Pedobacter sp.]|nr:MAG: glyoxalase [Pedobacter sp.]
MESLSPNIYVKDVSNTMEFYRKLGFKSIMTLPEGGEEPVWAMMQNGNVTIMFESIKNIEGRLPEISRQIGGSLLLYIKVQDINGLFESMKDQVTVLQEPQKTFYGATEFMIQDCNGFVLTFAD